ncbi:hypothetical protein V6N13_025030 [Hibiscus sabdariffa]|uniref:Uncharacterized protein n=2 Tax=Hibiscus sabdariffa TaxID=183260 RepID=A0ABR2A8X9_9ROSI
MSLSFATGSSYFPTRVISSSAAAHDNCLSDLSDSSNEQQQTTSLGLEMSRSISERIVSDVQLHSKLVLSDSTARVDSA